MMLPAAPVSLSHKAKSFNPLVFIATDAHKYDAAVLEFH